MEYRILSNKYFKHIKEGSINKEAFLTSDKCKSLLTEKEIFVFGTGVDAEAAQKELSKYAIILSYIDNNRHGEDSYFYGKSIISLEQCLEQKEKGQPIIIATYRFGIEICNQLIGIGLVMGVDFFVWDDLHIFACNKKTEKYIKFLSDIWGRTNIVKRNGIVLIPFMVRHEMLTIPYAYCGNFFAEKFDAAIYAYIGSDSNFSNAPEVLRKIYKAFNVECLVDSFLDSQRQSEADEIFISVWNNLSTWEDWKNITIYGISFGTTIIRHLLRTYIPSFNLKDERMYLFLKEAINTIVFWYYYIVENDMKAVLLCDGVSWEGYIRDIAIMKGIPTYIMTAEMAKATLNFHQGTPYQYFKDMWKQLTFEEQEYGIRWAKERIDKRLHGEISDVRYADRKNFAFAEAKRNTRVLDENDKIKIMICPHIFEEDCFRCGEQIFDNNYFSWLCHLGDLSNNTPNYDWYLKMHPSSARRDFIIIDMILQKYSRIKKIPSNISPLQLKDEGLDYALTVHGSIGHEYPRIGIQVINAGLNPHSTFDFTWNPKTKEEYDNLIMHLDKLDKRIDEKEIYQFYSLNYLFYNWNYIPWRELFFENPVLGMDRLELEANGMELGTWRYEEYIKEWTKERHEKVLGQLNEIFKKLDEWKPNVLYKRKMNE